MNRLGLSQHEITPEDFLAAKYLSMSTKRMSGGQKKLTNIFSNMIRYDFCELIILDEPLNNLDYSNVRAFSNVLTRIYRSKPELAIILVTHNLGVAAYMSDHIIVMRNGLIEDQGDRDHILHHSDNEYTHKLLDAVPSIGGTRYV